MQNTDLIIIGAGPVGLFTAFQAGMLNLNCIIIDSLDIVGGQCATLYPEKPIYDIPAYPQISGMDLIEKLQLQIKPFNQKISLNQKVINVDKNDSNYILKIKNQKDGEETNITTKSIIIATGGGTFMPNKPPLNNIEEYEGKSIFYSVPDKKIFHNKNVIIAGGGDSAVDWAITLSDIVKKIYLVHRRDKFRATPISIDLLHQKVSEKKVELVTPYQLGELKGKNGFLESIIVYDTDNNTRKFHADILLPFFGLAMNHDEILTWGVDMTHDKRHIIVDPSTMSTNRDGIFSVGDVAHYNGKLKLILTGFAEAALACHSAYKIINPDKEIHFEHSTTKGLPST